MSDIQDKKTLNFIINPDFSTELKFEVVDNIESLRQRIISYLYFFANTYFLNDEGFDYLNTPKIILESQINNRLLERFDKEITSIDNFTSDFENGKLSISSDVESIYGELNVRAW